VLDIVRHYDSVWRLLLAYDENRLPAAPPGTRKPAAPLTSTTARQAIGRLRDWISDAGNVKGLFGYERGHQFDGILAAIEQTFGGEPLYPSFEARAAHLLYFIIKDHPFADGNKRIASLLFLEYLDSNGALANARGIPRVSPNELVPLALLIAGSDPAHKDSMIRLTVNLLMEGAAPP
jgi:prophage maintenance system killer protein